MRKAILMTKFIERADQGDNILCEFSRTIELDDIPPIGYTVTFPEGKKIARFHIERADIQNKSGNLTLYNTMEIQRYENWDYTDSLEIITSMKKLGWSAKILFKEVKRCEELKAYHEQSV